MSKLLAKVVLGFAAILFSVGASCGPQPPNPNPTPTPTPEPPPVSLDLNRTLRQNAGKLTLLDGTPFQLDMGVQCCRATPGVDNSGWPLSSPAQMDFYKQYLLNGAHWRLGPFFGDADHEAEWAETGGAYIGWTGEFNPRFWATLEQWLQHAYDKNIWVEINIIDTWYCKHAASNWHDQQMPWPQEDIDACGISMTPVQEKYLRHAVKTLGRFPNIIWTTDNEGGEIRGTQRAWYEAVQAIIRDEERVNNYPAHLVGINNEDFADGPFDYVSTHAKAALLAPIAGKWTLNNERNPAFSVNQEIANFSEARKRGLSYAYWRAEQTEEQSLRTLEGFRDVIRGSSTPVGCFSPEPEDPLWEYACDPRGGEMACTGDLATSAVVAQLNNAKAKVGNRVGQDGFETLDLLGKEMRAQNLCSSDRWRDALAVKRPGSADLYEELHAVAFTDGGYTQKPYVGLWRYKGSSPVACGNPIPPPVVEWIVKEHTKGPNWTTLDSTALVEGRSYCEATGQPNRNRCPVRVEGDPQRSACESLVVGTPAWTGPGEVSPSNPYLYLVRRGVSGTATVCAKNGVCGSVEVTP